ncbi:Zn(II)2Cys6 transcription factor [Aspergillus bombycis]|uniref:Zn(II)2Cys6 transcription factor n=1 Tax=Aspergillus bombycis TaxID=109264 RepID=A0A1F8A471_9EURO|nr:Zn(II)2Cys6 transcription factor [Aspergillus bombycis]OGM46516.1 Zn(II)2Cys6 transcription factor [Aspergillus bombycis]
MLPGSVRAPAVSIAVDADENVGHCHPPELLLQKLTIALGDESKPTCTGCRRRGEKCQWRVLGSFREANIKVLEPGHPSMNQSVGRNSRQSKFKILNVDPPSARKERARKEQPLPERAPSPQPQQQEASAPSPLPVTYPDQAPVQLPQPDFNHCEDPGLSPSLSSNASFYPAAEVRNHERDSRRNDEATNELPNHIPHNASPNHPYMHSSPEFVIDELAALRSFSNNAASFPQTAQEPYQSIASPLFDPSVFSDPVNFTNDVFLPGSAYEALHTTLRNRQLWTARPDIPSRCSSPASVPDSGAVTPNALHPSQVNHYSRPRRPFELSPARENVLWQNYLNEICLWLDMFDNHRHFASTYPQMAKSAPHLRYSILALSARQIERKQNQKSQSESLSLYQEAIHLLLPELESKTTPVIASCVILCVLEMLSCNPKEWRRHLDGCAYLIQAAEINGFSGKEEQALFWCFARMDVCGGLISEEETIIPIHHWIPKDMSPAEASQHFLASNISAFDTYANYTVYLCAQTLGVLFNPSSQLPPSCVSCRYLGSPDDRDTYVHRWTRLFDSVEEWYDNRPNQMKSIFVIPASAGPRPFPTVLYGNGAAISGNQLYHTCALLLLQRKPKTLSLSRRPKSVLWHARQICAISASNTHHGCWTNALQPLWLAGKAMSHHSEHTAIIETLTRIERETGWATAWRVEDLKDFWGEDDDMDEMEPMRIDVEGDVSLQTPRSIRSH